MIHSARLFGASLVLASGLIASGKAYADPPVPEGDAARPAVVLEQNIEYGTGGGEKLHLNLARPKEGNGPFPAVIFIHGGAWQGGNKDMHNPQIQELAERGYVAVAVGYRLAPKHPHPAQIEDCKCAVRWLRAHAGDYKVDPERIGAVGLSAGAHLAMILGVADASDGLEGSGGWEDQSSKVKAVVSFAGPTDLTAKFPDVSVEILAKFVGGPPAEKQELLRQASPITYVNKGDAAMLLYQGTVDPLIPTEQAFAMATALTKASVPGRVELLVGAQHGWGEPDLSRTMAGMHAFLDQHLRPVR